MIDIAAPIQEVTVYTDRALITRRGTNHLEAGEHDIRINNLPSFKRDSLKAAGRGPQGTKIQEVSITTAFHARPPEGEIRKLQDEREQLQQQRQVLNARRDALKDRQQWLRALGEQSQDFARGLARRQMDTQDCANFFQFLSDQATRDAEEALKMDLQDRRLTQEIEAKKRELTQKQGFSLPDRLAAVIHIEMPVEGELEVEISYLIENASWHPQYDVRVLMDEKQKQGSVELTYIGLVQQSTGESWDNVELALSTARPSQSARLPELNPWYLKVPEPFVPAYPQGMRAMASLPAPAPRARLSGAPGGALEKDELDSDLDFGAPPPEPVAAEIATATVEQTGTAYVFRIGHRVSIPSDNQPHKTTIAYDDIPCSFDYVSAPALDESAHLRATIINSTERTLLKGDANIFLSGEYVGTTQIKQIAPTENFKIFLGIDDSVKIKREAIERGVEKGNLLQGDIRRSTYAYRITVQNYGKNTRRIVVRDHLPLTQHEKIKIKMTQLQPQPTTHDKMELVSWEFALPAGEKQIIEYRFVVEHPQGLQIMGLPR